MQAKIMVSAKRLASRVLDVGRLVRFVSFDTSTAAGRGQERTRRAALSATVGVASKLLSIAVGLISIPLAFGYLGAERYGLWMTVSSFSVLLMFADLGMGNGLLSAIANAHGRGDTAAARTHVATAFFMLSAIAIIMIAAFAASTAAIDWAVLLNAANGPAERDAGGTVAVFAVCTALALPLGTVLQVQNGYQEGFAANAWQALGSVFSLAGVVAAVASKAAVPWLAAGLMGGPLLATAVNWVVEFCYKRPFLFPRASAWDGLVARRVLATGLLFAAQSLSWALAYGTDNVVIARLIGTAAVAEYAIPMRLFSLISTIVAFFVAPLWPAYTEALARRDVVWASQALRRSVVACVGLAGAPALVLVATGPQLIRWWLASDLQVSRLVLGGMAVWVVSNVLGVTIMVFLNAVNAIRFLTACALLMSVVAVITKIAVAQVWGAAGIIWSTVLCMNVLFVVPCAAYARVVLRRWKHESVPIAESCVR